MLPQSRRLSSQRDFLAFRRGSRSRRGTFLDIRLRSTSAVPARFGFIVNKRVSKLATKRNSIKRRLRHIAAQLPNELTQNLELLIIAKPGAVEQKSQTLAHELRTLITNKPRATRTR